MTEGSLPPRTPEKNIFAFFKSCRQAADPFPSLSTAAANEACKLGATIECAAAWEEVDGLEDAAMRAGMSQNAPSAMAPKPPAKTSTPDAQTSKKKEDTSPARSP